ncbi:UNVERIFIED_CONTAM: RNA-directed DNA polymerase [Sesamum indicum]
MSKGDAISAVKLGRARELGILAEGDVVLEAAEEVKEGHVAAPGAAVVNIEHTLVIVQQQFQSVVLQLQNYNRNKSILGEGLTTTVDEVSFSRVAPQHNAGRENTSLSETGYSSIHKMEFPLFNGEEARAWIRRCTRYFQMIPIPEGQKIALASIHMQGRAELWYQGFVEKRGEPTWQELIVNVLERFEDLDYENVVTEFNKLHQDTSVNAYLEKFEELEAQMLIFNKQLSEEVFMMKFISGLQEEIKGYVATLRPVTLNQAIMLSRKQETVVQAIIKKTQQSVKNTPIKNAYRPVSKAPTYKPSYKPGYKSRNENSQPRRLLTEAEMRARREKNLCYNCGEVFVPGHKCKVRYSYVLMNEEEIKADEEDTEQLDTPTEEIEEEDVTVVKALNLETKETTPMRVSVADGFRLISKTMCPMLQWEMQESQFSYPIRTLKLGGCDFVLGCDWLKSHNPVKLDYNEGTITMTHRGKEIVLRALTGKAELRASLAEPLSGLLGRRTHDLVYQLFSAHNNGKQEMENPLIKGLLQRFEDVFQEPQSLPPEISIEHKIDLMPYAIPKKQPPYRYLNKLTIKHKFRIHVIDELLDELHGARYFTKIDLRSGYFQIRMRQEDISKTSFITHSGHYEFLVMPFGLCNAPATFQALMNQVFGSFLRKFVLVFFDDILVYKKYWNDHLLHLRKVLELLREHKLYAKKS